jgi:hypothetical protein
MRRESEPEIRSNEVSDGKIVDAISRAATDESAWSKPANWTRHALAPSQYNYCF